ncbi:MAG: hypothetical protein ACYS9X_06980 [Planctomycetota bacterium]|jgi:hypothetical protein
MPEKVPQQCAAFVRSHWVHLLLVPPMAIGVTVVHEFAHAVAVWGQGGSVTEFAYLPAPGEWGHIQYRFQPGAMYSSFAVSVSPYVLWVAIAGAALLTSFLKARWPVWAGSTLFVWCYVVPLADVGNTAVGWLAGSMNDFGSAFGPAGPLGFLATGLAVVIAIVTGYPLQKRLYERRALVLPAYGLLSSLTFLALVGFVIGLRRL